MAVSTTHSSRVSLSLTSIDYYSLYAGVGLGYDGAVSQIQVLAKPPFANADTQVQSIFSYMSYQAETGYPMAHTSGPYIDPRSCVKSSQDFIGRVGGDCREICADNATLFLPYNLNTCLTLSVVSLLVQNDNATIIDNREGAVEMEPTWSSFGDLSEWDSAGIINKITTCVVDACSQHNLTTCPMVSQNLSQIPPTINNLQKKSRAVWMGSAAKWACKSTRT